MISVMIARGVGILVCVALLIFMVAMAGWILRSYRTAMSRPPGKRLVVWYIAAIEAFMFSNVILVAEHVFWSQRDIPLVLTCLGVCLVIAGLCSALWLGFKLVPLNKQP